MALITQLLDLPVRELENKLKNRKIADLQESLAYYEKRIEDEDSFWANDNSRLPHEGILMDVGDQTLQLRRVTKAIQAEIASR
ncbi:hypothetical protein A2368_01855 [Candidatus Collierbacteria bacterium RIFOXYB1_FULL_49_13]|uniref:Uncharacterized protein n=1 Tax=Candidatus Collierbacteria bacterium RIFOXYB1_FULL_49_13 TaxID=1817728 RepID=A0A1F5FEN1_9BACT|nr:MAG: hypothetical protein A2368_01855 [Candidatus Collierbacteria bacterium RIFOXYB1_FULL_49_13]